MTFSPAPLPPPRPRAGRFGSPLWRRALAGAALPAVVAILATEGLPAFAQPAPERTSVVHHPASSVGHPLQSLTVPLSVELPTPERDPEMTVITPPPKKPRWVDPAAGELRDGFGPRPIAPAAGVSGFHKGQDIGAPCGAPIRAAAAGRVVAAGWSGTYGQWVLLDNGNGVQTGYAHASRILTSTGRRVAAGTEIAEVGTTGASSGCHLHFETRVGGEGVDPRGFMRSRGVALGR